MANKSNNSLVGTIISEASRLQGFLENISSETWQQDSSSDGWTIEDVVVHLAVSSAGWATNIARALAGDSGPPQGQSFVAPGERASHPSGPSAREGRRQSGPQILEDFIAGHARLREVMETLTDDDLDMPCFHRRGVVPVRGYLGIQLQELALHGWDIRWGLDSEAELWGDSLEWLIDLVPRWIRTSFTPGLDLPIPVGYRFDVSGPIMVDNYLIVSRETFNVELYSSQEIDASFHCDTGNYILLMFGRLQVEAAIADGRLSVDGSLQQAKNFNSWFKGF